MVFLNNEQHIRFAAIALPWLDALYVNREYVQLSGMWVKISCLIALIVQLLLMNDVLIQKVERRKFSDELMKYVVIDRTDLIQFSRVRFVNGEYEKSAIWVLGIYVRNEVCCSDSGDKKLVYNSSFGKSLENKVAISTELNIWKN